MAGPKKAPPEVAVLPTAYVGTGGGRPKLPPAPEVDEAKIGEAENAMGTTDPRNRVPPFKQAAPRRSRRKKEPPKTESMLVKGPAPVIDAFNKYKEDQGFKSSWAALEELLLNSGVSVPEFDT